MKNIQIMIMAHLKIGSEGEMLLLILKQIARL